MADRTSLRVKTTGVDSVSGAAVNSYFTLNYIRNDFLDNAGDLNESMRQGAIRTIGFLLKDTVTGGVAIQETDINLPQSLVGGVSDNGNDNKGTGSAGKVR